MRLMLWEQHPIAGLVHGEAHELGVVRQVSLGLRLNFFVRLRPRRKMTPI
jgi:hypothetical protein